MENKISRYTLKDLRKINNLTLDQVAMATNLPKEEIADYELDSSDIERNKLRLLAKFYNIDVNYIFLEKNEKPTFEVDLALCEVERRNGMILKLSNSIDDQLSEICKMPEEKILYATGNLEEIDLFKDCIFEIMKINQKEISKVCSYFEKMEYE
ncbi:helix-turn-helix domain-containing protein [Lactococcus garvieae]|uniref:Helix-turn-helix domain-containing protein n=1 Tax=Lactococcus garvieae TaxID=1363 RepID=A0A1I4I5X7_9LACT|nr:helix-turn-helix transcriptional regulator [Lactococcus garvieae]SFL49818.1 Helix-turn-helix domain-containing protein [Lactococcus garvieae]